MVLQKVQPPAKPDAVTLAKEEIKAKLTAHYDNSLILFTFFLY